MKKIHIGLLPRIVIAIAAGIAFGNVLPMMLIRAFVTFNGIFSEFLNFSIPLIIVGLVTVAIANIGKGAGKMLLATVLIAYGATLLPRCSQASCPTSPVLPSSRRSYSRTFRWSR